jgi:small nuclear ribonucleoprotein (snRNP)-like protein
LIIFIGKYKDRFEPLGSLYAAYKENILIRVVIRGGKQIRGECTGKILAFDKHWNLILRDAEERYKSKEYLGAQQGICFILLMFYLITY